MQIIVQRQALLGALKRASAAITTGDALAYKSSILLEALGTGPATIASSDGVLRILTELGCDTKKPGTAMLPSKRLTDIANQLPNGFIEISVSPKLQVSVKSLESKRKFTMQAYDLSLYPPVLKHADGETLYRIEAKIFLQAVDEVAFIVDKGFSDAILLARSESNPLHCQIVSLSPYGMAAATAWFTGQPDVSDEILIPSRLCTAAGHLEANADELQIQADDHRITILAPGTIIACDRVAVSFPAAWRHILSSKPQQKRFRCSAQALLDSVRAVSVAAEMVEGQERFVQIDIKYQNHECWVATRKSETNQGEDELQVQDAGPGDCVIHMDGSRLSAGLRAFGPDDVDLFYDVAGAEEAFCLQSETLAVMLMPIREIKAK